MKPVVLIVDDEESIRYAFGQHLIREGYEVHDATDFDSAIGFISTMELDLVITDIILGGQTGIDILLEIKKRALHCPVVVITGDPNIETASDAVRIGAFDYLSKPVKKETLLRVVKNAIQLKQLIDEKKQIEKEKEQYRFNLKAIFRSLSDAVISVDNQMTIIEANESTETICGLNPNHIIGNRLSNDLCSCSQTCYTVLENTLKTSNSVKEFRTECKRKDRSDQIVILTSSPLLDSNGLSIGAILVIRDITRLNDLEQKLRGRQQFRNIIGKSPEMQRIFSLVKNLSETDTSVLITGESGTGKELIARALHYESYRSEKPLITVNCSALSENLLESELFGHVKGAFTGAIKERTGRFQLADKGTLFLDEIGTISSVIQLKLLRVIQERQIEKVGDTRTIDVDVRIIAATNSNLKEKIEQNEFRKDLYYRLKVVELTLPPLRSRREDIPLLADYFLTLLTKRMNREIDRFSAEAIECLLQYSWPGNIRELEHAVEHAVIMCHDRTIFENHLPEEIRNKPKIPPYQKQAFSSDDKLRTIEALKTAGWNKAKAARLLNLSRQGIYRKIAKYNITSP